VEALRTAEQRIAGNVNLKLVCERLSAQLFEGFNPPAGSAPVTSWMGLTPTAPP
jgi:hypothetical protein